MKHWRCKKCHHEWDGSDEASACDWCGEGSPVVLEEETTFSRFCREFLDDVE